MSGASAQESVQRNGTLGPAAVKGAGCPKGAQEEAPTGPSPTDRWPNKRGANKISPMALGP